MEDLGEEVKVEAASAEDLVEEEVRAVEVVVMVEQRCKCNHHNHLLGLVFPTS